MSFECSRRRLLEAGALVASAAVLPVARSRAQEISTVMDVLSRYMAAARERPLPAEVIEHTKHHVLDTFAAMVSGTELLPGRAAIGHQPDDRGEGGDAQHDQAVHDLRIERVALVHPCHPAAKAKS